DIEGGHSANVGTNRKEIEKKELYFSIDQPSLSSSSKMKKKDMEIYPFNLL
ncbi:hypothetical protein MKX03_002479, partial [Papaver bracteatum]